MNRRFTQSLSLSSSSKPSNTGGTKEHQGDDDTIVFLKERQQRLAQEEEALRARQDRHSTGTETERRLGVNGLTLPDVPQEDASDALRQLEVEAGGGSYYDDATLNSSWADEDDDESVTS